MFYRFLYEVYVVLQRFQRKDFRGPSWGNKDLWGFPMVLYEAVGIFLVLSRGFISPLDGLWRTCGVLIQESFQEHFSESLRGL